VKTLGGYRRKLSHRDAVMQRYPAALVVYAGSIPLTPRPPMLGFVQSVKKFSGHTLLEAMQM